MNLHPPAKLFVRLMHHLSTLTSGIASDEDGTEPGFEIAQSMGIALLGLVVAAAFAQLLEELGIGIITAIRGELGM